MAHTTIFVVDKIASIRQVIGCALKNAGYDVIEAGDGNAALSQLNGQRINGRQISLIITDIDMSTMDGIAFIKGVKQLPHHLHTPIIVLSAESQESKKREGQEAGARAWLEKPFQINHLLAAVSLLEAS